MPILPKGLAAYSTSPVFTEETLPESLTKEHRIKAGTWGVIHVTSGRLRFRAPAKEQDRVLTPETKGLVEPEVVHWVTPLGPVQFYIEFWR